jgi:hypothetical protein
MLRLLFGAVLLSSGCSLVGAPCRSQADCGGELGCAGPDDRRACGIGPRRECASNTDCTGGGFVCNAVIDSCSDTGIGSQCGSPCTATSCGAGLRCNAGGACETVPCDEGFACSATQKCSASAAHSSGAVWSRTQGCVAVTCAKDAECAAGQACVNGVCQSGPGVCKKIEAVP